MLFKVKDNVPEVYIKESRDFQLISQAFDVMYNTLLSNQFKLNYIDDIELVDAKLLDLISKYLGFFTSEYYPEDLLRSILINFPQMIRYKGSSTGVKLAITSLQNAYSNISYINIATDSKGDFTITTDGVVINQKYIDEVLKYVLPIGALVIQTRVIQDMNDLPPENIGNTDNVKSLLYKRDSLYDDSSYEVDFNNLPYDDSSEGTPNYWVIGQIRKSSLQNKFNNFYLSKIGQTPVITKGIVRKIIIKNTENNI